MYKREQFPRMAKNHNAIENVGLYCGFVGISLNHVLDSFCGNLSPIIKVRF